MLLNTDRGAISDLRQKGMAFAVPIFAKSNSFDLLLNNVRFWVVTCDSEQQIAESIAIQ